MGIEFHTQPFQYIEKEDGSRYCQWQFQPKSKDGRFNTKELMDAWFDEDWHDNNSEHPFAYCISALRNREFLLDVLKDRNPTVVIKHDGKTWYVPKNGEVHQKLKEIVK
jgi:hypothetical protein